LLPQVQKIVSKRISPHTGEKGSFEDEDGKLDENVTLFFSIIPFVSEKTV
jgi:hypothetical protein